MMKLKTFLLSLWLVPTVSLANDYSLPYGEWRGQTQYQAFIGGKSDLAAHTITNLTISIDPGGKVVGKSAENGCALLGLAAPGMAPTLVTLDVTVTGCAYAGLNRSYKGLLSVFSKERHAKFSLQALDSTSGKGGTYNISATMRR